MNPNPEEKSSNELERLRAELQRQRQTLDAVMERLKAQEELTRDTWEVLAVLWKGQELADKANAKRVPKETVNEEENEFFFRRLGAMLKHEDKIKQVLEGMKQVQD